VEDRQHAGQLADAVGEVVDLRPRVDREAHGDHGLERPPSARGRFGVEALEDARLAQRADACEARRGARPTRSASRALDPRVLAQRARMARSTSSSARRSSHGGQYARRAEQHARYLVLPNIMRKLHECRTDA